MSRHSSDLDTDGSSDSASGAESTPEHADESFFRRLVERHPEGTVTVDGTGSIVYANRAFARLLGYDAEALLDRPIGDVLVGTDGGTPAVFDHDSDSEAEEAKTAGEPGEVDATDETGGTGRSEGTARAAGAPANGDATVGDEHPVGGRHADGHELALSVAVIDRDGETTTGVVRERGDGGSEAGDTDGATDTGTIGGGDDPTMPADHERERRLGALHEATRTLVVADSTRAVAEEVVDAAQSILDIPIAAVRLRTPEDHLELAAWTDATEDRLGLERTYAVGNGPVGRAFESGERVVYDDLSECEDGYDREGIGSGAYLPLGEHGVVSLGARGTNGFDETDLQLATLLATNATVAIERAERGRTLEALHDTTRRLMQAESPEEVARLAVETARDVLDFPLTGVWLYDEDDEALQPVAYPPEADELVESVPTYTAGDSLSWRAFATGEVQVHEDTAATEGTYSETPTIRNEIIVPLGRHGVLNVGSTAVEEFDDEDIYFARVLAANTEAALDRAARERELASQRDELVTLARINALIQEIIQGLTDAVTRGEIEEIVCARFAESERYRFAWIGEHDAATGRLVARTATDRAEAYLDAVEIGSGEGEPMGRGPSGRAARTGEVQVSHDVFEDPTFEPWREQAREFGYRSTAAVPLRHEQVTYGQLAVYAVEADAFGERERAALSVLGETVGFALNAARNIQLLRGNSVTELAFGASGAATLLGTVSTRLDCTVTLGSVVPSGEGTLQYATVEGATAEDVHRVLADATARGGGAVVTDWRVIEADDDGCRFELAVSDSAPGSLVAAGATVRTVVAEEGTTRIVAEAPPDADVRAIVDRLRDTHPGIELRAKRETDRPVRTADEFRYRIEEALTDRQRTALEAAYAAGYYDWPRESTAEEVAASMGIASPTLHSHLRKAQRKVLDVLFDDRS